MAFWFTRKAPNKQTCGVKRQLNSPTLSKLTAKGLEYPQKVQTTKKLTQRVFQLKLVGWHVVQRRMQTFGIIHILQKCLQARLSLLESLILVHIYIFTFDRLEKLSAKAFSVGCPGVDMLMQASISSKHSTYTLLQYCLPRSEWWINPVRGWRWVEAISRACRGSCASIRRERLQLCRPP
jgi:hypothetical protein